MREEPRIHRRQRPAPRPAEPPAANQNVPDKPDDAVQGPSAATPIIRQRTRPAPPVEAPRTAPLPSVAEQTSVEPGADARPASGKRTRRKEYDVGYKKPPKEHRFKPGINANPKGRPKGSKNMATKVAEALDEKVDVLRNGKPVKMAKRDIIAERLVNKSLETLDPRLLKMVIDMFPSAEVSAPDTTPDPREAASNEAMLKFLEAMVRDGGSLLPPASEPPSDPADEDDDKGKAA